VGCSAYAVLPHHDGPAGLSDNGPTDDAGTRGGQRRRLDAGRGADLRHGDGGRHGHGFRGRGLPLAARGGRPPALRPRRMVPPIAGTRLADPDGSRGDGCHPRRSGGAVGTVGLRQRYPACRGGVPGPIATLAALVVRWEPLAYGSGIPHVEAVYRGQLPPSRIRLLPAKFIGGLLAIGSGLVLGREGPTVHMGAAIGTEAARRARLPESEIRMMQTALGVPASQWRSTPRSAARCSRWRR